MNMVREKVYDKRVTERIKKFWKSGVMEGRAVHVIRDADGSIWN